MRNAGSGPDSPATAIFATLPVTASGHPGNLGLVAPKSTHLPIIAISRDLSGKRIERWRN